MSSSLQRASQYIGSQAFDDLCQEFVEQAAYGSTGHYASAIDAWNKQQQNAVSGTNGIQPGDLVYFAPDQSNNYYGHAGIYTGNNQFVSATNNGVQYNDLNSWQKGTGQRLLGYIPQGQSAGALGQQLNKNTGSIQGMNPQQVISQMDNHTIPWDDNLRARMNNMINGQSTTEQQQPQYNFAQEMENFKNVWNLTHNTPLAGYM